MEWTRGRGLYAVRIERLEGVFEHIVRNAAALHDSLRLVEVPVNAKVDAALPVLLFGL